MARGNPEFCKVETDFVLTDPRYALMTGDEVKVYLFLWAAAVKERRQTPRQTKDIHFLSQRVQIPYETIPRLLTNLSRSPLNLIKLRKLHEEEYSVTLVGVMEKHKQLEWKILPHLGNEWGANGSESRVEKSREEKSTPIPPTGESSSPSPFDEIVLPKWREWAAKKWVEMPGETSQSYADQRAEVNRHWKEIEPSWQAICAEMEIAHFIHVDWHPNFKLLTRKNQDGTLKREMLTGKHYRLSKAERDDAARGKPSSPAEIYKAEYDAEVRKWGSYGVPAHIKADLAKRKKELGLEQ